MMPSRGGDIMLVRESCETLSQPAEEAVRSAVPALSANAVKLFPAEGLLSNSEGNHKGNHSQSIGTPLHNSFHGDLLYYLHYALNLYIKSKKFKNVTRPPSFRKTAV